MSLPKPWQIVVASLTTAAPILVWLLVFSGLKLSSIPADWADFGTFVSGTVAVVVTIWGFILLFLTYKKQVEDSYIAGFESTLFKLIDYQDEIIKNTGSAGTNEHGQDALVFWATKAENSVRYRWKSSMPNGSSFSSLYREILCEKTSKPNLPLFRLGQYHAHLMNIFRYIDGADLSPGEKIKYIRILRSRFSTAEIILIGINGIYDQDQELRNIIERYGLLTRIVGHEFLRCFFIEAYHPRAFGDEDLSSSLIKLDRKEPDWYQYISEEKRVNPRKETGTQVEGNKTNNE